MKRLEKSHLQIENLNVFRWNDTRVCKARRAFFQATNTFQFVVIRILPNNVFQFIITHTGRITHARRITLFNEQLISYWILELVHYKTLHFIGIGIKLSMNHQARYYKMKHVWLEIINNIGIYKYHVQHLLAVTDIIYRTIDNWNLLNAFSIWFKDARRFYICA